MQKKEFIRQLNELVPRPDPVTTEALYRFDRECAESEYGNTSEPDHPIHRLGIES